MSMEIHRLKTDSGFYHDILHSKKRFDIRKNDRDFAIGDLLLLEGCDKETGDYIDQQKHPPILVRVT